jgi:membrane-associated PAP2 superfamily phosphatase
VKAIFYGLVVAIAAIAVLSAAGINVDLAVAGLFFDRSSGMFATVDHPAWSAAREHGYVAVAVCIGCMLLAGLRFITPRLPGLSLRSAAFLTAALLLGPGLLVNIIMKSHWGRPRPAELIQFGGSLHYVDWWNPSGACITNCSFMAGEPASAAWLFGPALLAPARWRGIAVAAATMFTFIISLMRIAAGGHFLTDVLWGVLSTVLILLVLRQWIDPPPAPGAAPQHRR